MNRPQLVAIIAAYNEEDIIGAACAHLVEQGALIYLLDDGSTDRTVDVVRASSGDRLLGAERLPPLGAAGGRGTFSLTRILERKSRLASTLDADWFINHDADEFRESPWPHLSLAEAVMLVGRLGWNAIDFEVFDFAPTGEEIDPIGDPTAALLHCRPAAVYDRLQIRCWKKTPVQVDLASTGGHEARFAGRRVFPIRFPMRHYPIRSAAHAARKIYQERLPRFDPVERARGWHVQYDKYASGAAGQEASVALLPYDADASRIALQVRNRLVEAACPSVVPGPAADVAETARQIEDELARKAEQMSALTLALERRQLELDALEAAREELQTRLRAALSRAAGLEATGAALETAARALRLELAQADRNALDAVRRLDEVYASRSWRLTGPLRAAWRLLGGR
jgi:hypothetical protein